MKTKIIYISGNEIFDMADIRAAFDEVRGALNLEKNTVLFGVPIDEDDVGLGVTTIKTSEKIATDINDNQQNEIIEKNKTTESTIESENVEPIIEKPTKKRGNNKKTIVKPEKEDSEESNTDEKIVPILSVLSTKESIIDAEKIAESEQHETVEQIEIIEDITNETEFNSEADTITQTDKPDFDEPDLEKLLSEMQPLQEDMLDEQHLSSIEPQHEEEPENIDATLEKLATEFVETQDKIASNTKSSSRSKIGKLRNILPFKQSKHHDQGLGDLFGWAGVAANDEEFSVPGFFTTASSKK